MAAVAGVGAAVAATDRIVRGECVNAFCITRPPGHHAGRALHPMKAVSNGFCILNPVACAALHATTPMSSGGLGLSRVCIIDFDVHHGNGTQDILCSTYDPKFLYVSLHAGGAEINGHPMDDDPNHELHDLGCNPKMSGIYPGRCGDTSPHKGVLNIPLGACVTSHAVGTALLNLVSPRVEEFAPDLIILSAGFDAHKSDPMGLGGLVAEDFGHITQVACQLAFKLCSGRVLSILEGGYGVPCCRPQQPFFLPSTANDEQEVKPDGIAIRNGSGNETRTNNPAEEQSSSAPVTVLSDEGTGERETVRSTSLRKRPQPSKLLELGDDLPDSMDDQVPYALQARLEKCHAEGFIECVCEHVRSLSICSKSL
jgi:acetoin utilization deacetylase AcuC-like enzyme